MSNEELVTLTFQDRVAIVTLNRPDKLNALNQDLYYLLAERLRQIERRDDIFITVLTGTGRFFSAYVQPDPNSKINVKSSTSLFSSILTLSPTVAQMSPAPVLVETSAPASAAI
jgi:hypothetical protein